MSDKNNAEKAIDSTPAGAGTTLGAQQGVHAEHNTTVQLIALWIVIITLIGVLIAAVFGAFAVMNIMLGLAVVSGIVYGLTEWQFGKR